MEKIENNTRFVFLTPSYNCEKTIAQTIFSMISQSYDNWRAIIIDDVSHDKTSEVISNLSKSLDFDSKISLVKRCEKYGEVRNTVDCLKMIDDNEVVCRLDGGDWLTENDTLAFLNELYKNYNPDVMWTSHRWAYTNYNISGALKLAPDQTVYTHPWVSSHMKTFRAKRLKEVPKENFYDENGDWIMIACDQAIFLPMMHMSHISGRPLIHFPHVCYHYAIDLNDKTLFSCDRSQKQKMSAEILRQRGFLN